MADLQALLSTLINLDESRMKPFRGFIFLCGGKVDALSHQPVSVRDAICRELVKYSEINNRVRLAEDFKDWSHDGIYRELASFERHLAELSSLIVLVLESPGSLAELGLFSVVEEFQEKLLVFMETEHYRAESFIRLGPIDFLEKIKRNQAHCHRWSRTEGQRLVFVPELAAALQPELAEAIQSRLLGAERETNFDSARWLHVALLICDLANLFAALTIRELRELLRVLNIHRSESDLRQTLYVLELAGFIRMEPKGDQRFYVAADNDLFLHLQLSDRSIDLDRFRLDVLQDYERSDKKRFRAIQDVRRAR